jgi:uncharacterized protein YggE
MFYRKALFAVVVVLSALTIPAYCAPIRPVPSADALGITVMGHSDISAKPDVVYLSVGVQTQNRDQAMAVADNSTTMHRVIESLHASNIAQPDIQTETYSVEPQYDYRGASPVLTGYQVINSLRVTIHDMAKAGLITDKAVTAGATQVGGLTYDIANKKKVQGEALTAAIADARAKADLAAGAAGVGLGRLLSLSEAGAAQVEPIFKGAARPLAMEAAPPTPINPQVIHVNADVVLLYAIDYSEH